MRAISKRLISTLAAALLFQPAAAAQRIMSVSAEKANVRENPGTGSPVLWKAWRFTPFEVMEWRGEWAYVKDFEEDTGWLHRSVLSETPTVIVSGKYANIRTGPGLDNAVVAVVEREYPLKALAKDGGWLKVSDGDGIEGWIYISLVWGETDPDVEGL